MNNNFKLPKNEKITMHIVYNVNHINKETILNKLFQLNNEKVDYKNDLKDKITGTVKILSEKINRDNNCLNELNVKILFTYDRRALDFDMYLFDIMNKISNSGYCGLFGIISIEINQNGIPYKSINL